MGVWPTTLRSDFLSATKKRSHMHLERGERASEAEVWHHEIQCVTRVLEHFTRKSPDLTKNPTNVILSLLSIEREDAVKPFTLSIQVAECRNR
jgi:hypothetical protein